MKKDYSDMNFLAESEKYLIGYIFEDAYLIDKNNEEIIFQYKFYGNPSCGIIDENDEWAVIAGDHLIIWKGKKIININKIELKWVHSIRARNDKVIEILIDPWSDKAAIWSLNMNKLEFKKLRDFSDYKEKEYTDHVIW